MGKKKCDTSIDNLIILPFIALDHFVVTPMIPQPLKIDNEDQKRFIEKGLPQNSQLFVATSIEESFDKKEPQIKNIGIVCDIDKVLQMPGAPSIIFVRPAYKAVFRDFVYSPSFPMAKVAPLPDIKMPKRLNSEVKMTLDHIDRLFTEIMKFTGDIEHKAAFKLVEEYSISPLQHLYALIHVAPMSWEEKYSLLECNSFTELVYRIADLLDVTQQKVNLQADIHEKTHHELSRQQKETFLRTHLKQIQNELGEGEDNDLEELSQRARNKKWSDGAKEHFQKELKKLGRLNINNPEYSVQYSYLESLLDLPWNNYVNKKISLNKVKEVLDRDHYGLDKVKERILEYMAVVKLRNDLKSPILCLYGPPGVGKTSIGKSVAEAVGREYARIALGGVHDEAEIRGHRKTYIGAMPGRFLHTMSKLKYGNPLLLLDEIDKVGKDYKGDPSSALLEALDPEQNNSFHDNFIDYPYDLSKVLFIATANDLATIPPPLRDRMEIIEMPKYSQSEKREIALRHLVDKALVENGFKKGEIKFSPEAIDTIIKKFTHEAGVRQLSKQLNRIIRKLALLKVTDKETPLEITPGLVVKYLDKQDTWHTSLGFHA